MGRMGRMRAMGGGMRIYEGRVLPYHDFLLNSVLHFLIL